MGVDKEWSLEPFFSRSKDAHPKCGGLPNTGKGKKRGEGERGFFLLGWGGGVFWFGFGSAHRVEKQREGGRV